VERGITSANFSIGLGAYDIVLMLSEYGDVKCTERLKSLRYILSPEIHIYQNIRGGVK